jgi:hypothetical protein
MAAMKFEFKSNNEGGAQQTVYVDQVRHGLINEPKSVSLPTTATGATIGNDGTNPLVAYHDTTNDRVTIWTLDPSTLAVTATVNTGVHSFFQVSQLTLAGVLKGNFDFGATRYMVKSVGSENWWSFNTSGTFQSAEAFPADGGGSKAIAWDGSNFLALSTAGQLIKHTDEARSHQLDRP